MRNKKAYQYGLDSWRASYSGDPSRPFIPVNDSVDDYYDCDYYDDWDDFFYGYQVYRSKELQQHVIKNSNRDFIRMQLKNVQRNKNCRNLFEDIFAGNFCITISAGALLANTYYVDNLLRYAEFSKLNDLSLNIYEFHDNDLILVDVTTDERFNMTKWSKAFDSPFYDQPSVTLNQIIEIIAHCVRLGRASSFV